MFNAQNKILFDKSLTNNFKNIEGYLNLNNVCVIVDVNVQDNSYCKKIFDGFKQLCDKLEIYPIEALEPTTDIVDELTRKIRSNNYTLIVSIGGGSVIDLCKAVSVMTYIGEKTELFHAKFTNFTKKITHVAIPTTSGTGSEVTPGAVLLNPKKKLKRALAGNIVMPDYTILYPQITYDQPVELAIFSGYDALSHSIESFTAKNSNCFTTMYSKEAFKLIINSLPCIKSNMDNYEIRYNILLGSCMAGIAIYNSNTGAAHSMSYALGAYEKINHSKAIAMVLSKVIKNNVDKGFKGYNELIKLIVNGNNKENNLNLPELLNDIEEKLEIQNYLNQCKKFTNEIEFLAQKSLELTSALENNPVLFEKECARKILSQIINKN